jgi:serine/threonine protein kinase
VRKSVVGTLVYLAPELMDQKKSLDVSKPTDVYSYGVLLWEMVHKKHAFEDVEPARLAYHIMTCRQNHVAALPVSSDCDPALKTIIEGCLQYDPALRPSFDDIKTSLWQAMR